jgi:hypothetical protein
MKLEFIKQAGGKGKRPRSDNAVVIHELSFIDLEAAWNC